MRYILISFALFTLAQGQLFESKRKYPTAQDLPFLKYASTQTKKDVFEVIGERQLSMDEKEDIIADIVAKDTEQVKKDFEKFRNEVRSRREKKERAILAARGRMSDQAAVADEYIEGIVRNGDLNPVEKKKMIGDIMNGLAENVRRELYKVHVGLKKVMKRALKNIKRKKGKSDDQTALEIKSISFTNDDDFIQL
ncbi:unnamed protein product, partial [Mesorhabditis belari]|uniref:DUF148 domain-containing protein n=1 Tax=Mesorhabditis belari TaxID=2138241 RepID=A0AAF3ESA7_9BILA